MATRVTTTASLIASAAHVAYNLPNTDMVVADQSSGIISTFHRAGQSKDWISGDSWSSGGLLVSCICWAAPEFGSVVCAGFREGVVSMWAQNSQGEWRIRAEIAANSHAATCARFAPRQMGPIVAVAFADGAVRTFIATAPLNADSWDSHSELQLDRTLGGCVCLSWREWDPTLPALVVLGSAIGRAEIWMFKEQLLRWERVAQIPPSAYSIENQSSTNLEAVGAVAWAPRMGRPFEVVAVAVGQIVTLWSLSGAVDSLIVERMAVLQHDHVVLQLEWNLLGSWLAASTEGGEVCMWRADLAGEWLLLNKITGGASQSMEL